MKRITAILAIIVLVIMAVGGAAAAYTADDVFAKLADSNVPEAYILQAEAYFTANPMTEAQAEVIMQHIEAALLIADGKTKASELTSEQRGAIFQELVKAGQVLDLVVTYEGSTDYAKGTVYVRDSEGNIVFMVSAEDAVKQTGFDYAIILAGIGVLILAGGVALFSANRKKQATAV